MKRRIIAALTALVMVVTMIPSSAFAAGQNDAKYVEELIKSVVVNDTIQQKDKTTLDKAKSLYDGLGEKQADVNKDLVADMYAALDAFDTFKENKKVFEEKAAAFEPGKVTPAFVDTNASTLVSAYNAAKGDITGTDVETSNRVTLKGLTAEEQESVFDKDYVALANVVELPAFKSLMERAGYLEGLTDADIAKINAKTYNDAAESGEAYKRALYAVAAGKGLINDNEALAPFVNLMVNGDKYLAVEKIFDKYDALQKDITELVTAYDKVDTVAEVKVVAKNSEAFEEYKANIKKGDDIVSANGRSLEDDFDATTKYNTQSAKTGFIDKYDTAKAVYDYYMNLESLEKELRAIPEAKDVEKNIDSYSFEATKALYEQTLALKKTINDIAKITGETSVGSAADYTKVLNTAALGTNLDDVNKLMADRMKDFGSATLKQYVDDFMAAVNKLPDANNVTRKDVATVNEAIEALNSYVAITGANIDVTALPDKVEKQADVFALAAITPYDVKALDNEKDQVFKKAIDEKSWLKVVAASEEIQKDADADMKAAKKVAGYIMKANNALTGTEGILNTDRTDIATINNKTTAEAAQSLIKKYNEEYAKLNDFAKADFENAVKYAVSDFVTVKGTDGKSMTPSKVVEKATVEIRKHIIDEDMIDLGFKVKGLIDTLLICDDALVKENLEGQRSQIATIDNYFKDAAFKSYFEDSFATEYAKYVARKAKVDSYVSESAAVVAVDKAILALNVIDINTTVDKAKVVADIAAYENVEKSINALTSAEQAALKNMSTFNRVKAGLQIGLEKVFIAEVAKIGNYTVEVTSEQADQINSITALIKDYGSKATPANKYFNEKTTSNTALKADLEKAYSDYSDAVTALEASITNKAEKEFLVIKPFINQVAAYARLDKTTAADYIKAVELVNGLSKEAMEVFAEDSDYTSLYTAYTTNIAPKYKDAKTFLLDYATVTVADQEYTGEALTPAVVVKNSDGQVIDAKEYTVAYSNNTNPGTATVLVTANADAKIGGTAQATFKITVDQPEKVTGVKADTDYGIVRVYFDRNADIEGMDVRYEVQYKKDTADKWTVKYPTKGYEYLTLKNLTKNGKYDVKVRAYFLVDGVKTYGDFSDEITVYANRNGAKSGIMYKAVISSLTTKNGSVTVKVKDVNYTSEPTDVTWKYSYKKYGTQYKTWSTWKSTKNTSYTFKNLKKGTRYVFRVQYTYTSAVDGKTAVNSNYSVYKNIVVK